MTRILIAQLLLWPMLVPGTPAAGQIPTGERDDSASTRAGRFTDEALMLESALARDIFNYVATGRRDPFLPVAVPTPLEGSSSLEAEVLGIISHTDPRLSVVVVRIARARAGETDHSGGSRAGGAGDTYRLRLGDRIGNTRVLAIHEHHVVVEVEGPAGIERRLLELPGARRGAR